MDALVLVVVAQVIRQRQPTGSAFAWLLSIILVPYAGIPLYLAFGGRKFKRRAREKGRLRLGEHAPDDAKRALGLESTLDAVEWLDDSVLAYETFLREIRNATHSIRIVTFVVGDDPTGNGIIDALVERASAGVEVRLLLDDLLRFHAPARNLARLKAAGGRLGRFMPLVHLPFRGQDNLRNHRKIALFDGKRAVVGGMNLAISRRSCRGLRSVRSTPSFAPTGSSRRANVSAPSNLREARANDR
jgi:cardiolipin synthase